MQFRVPQFIEVEDKIFGPFTFKQFLYLVGGLGLSYLLQRLLPIYIAVLLIIPIILLSLALAFYKINNKPFIFILESFVKYTLSNKLYIWKKIPKALVNKNIEVEKETEFVPKLSDSKLKDLSWSLDVLDLNKKQ